MAMLIGKFHKLIESKAVWAAILVLIVLSFVVWGTPFLMSSESDLSRDAAGTIGEETVSRQELQTAMTHIRASIAMSMGQLPPWDETTEPLIRQAAWRRIAALREAARMGASASAADVREAIASQSAFHQNGRFHLETYRGVVARMFGNSGLGEGFFEEHIRQELILQQVRMLAAQAVLAPPTDVERVFSMIEDQFRVEHIELQREVVEASVQVSGEDIQAFFERDPSRYEIAPKVVVRYVAFSPDAFMEGLAEPDAEDVEDFYDENRSRFIVKVPATPPAEGAPAASGETPETVDRLRPLDEVRAEIVTEMKRAMAMNRAEQASADFVNRIAPERREKPVSFEDAAKLANVEVRVTPAFDRAGPVEGVQADASFIRAAFDLADTPDTYFSYPVRGEDAYYVLANKEQLSARIPELKEVREAVAADAREAAVAKALTDRAESLIADLRAGKTTMADAAKALGLTVTTPEPFTAATAPRDNPHAERMIDELAGSNTGDVLPAIRTFDDSLLIARVIERIPAPREKLADMRRSLASMVLREREGAFMREYDHHLLHRSGFEETIGRRPADDED